MNFDPQKFFCGLVDLFAICFQALFTFLTSHHTGPLVLGDRYDALGGDDGTAVFLAASYLTGHIAFLLSSWLDRLYDALRRRTVDKQIEFLASGDTPSPLLVRVMV